MNLVWIRSSVLSIELLFIYTVSNYNVFDTMCYAGRIVNQRNRVTKLGNGWCRQRLNPS